MPWTFQRNWLCTTQTRKEMSMRLSKHCPSTNKLQCNSWKQNKAKVHTPHRGVPLKQIAGTWCADWNPDVLQFSQFVLEWCERSWKIDTLRGESENVSVSSKAQPQCLPRGDDEMNVNRTIVAYPTVRSEIRTFNMQGNQQRYECNNLFQGRIPNRVIVGLVLSEAFNGTVASDPFCFQKFGVSNISNWSEEKSTLTRPWN